MDYANAGATSVRSVGPLSEVGKRLSAIDDRLARLASNFGAAARSVIGNLPGDGPSKAAGSASGNPISQSLLASVGAIEGRLDELENLTAILG